jgi:hypothetical protein
MEKCTMLDSEREILEQLAAKTDDPLLGLTLTLVLRGASLPAPVIQCFLNGCAAMLDAHDVAKRVFGGKK